MEKEYSVGKIDLALDTKRDVLKSLIFRMSPQGISGEYRRLIVVDDSESLATVIEDLFARLAEGGYNNRLARIDCRKITSMEHLRDTMAVRPSEKSHVLFFFENVEAFDPSFLNDQERRYCLNTIRIILRNDSGEEPPAIACVNNDATVSQEFFESIFRTSFCACSRVVGNSLQQLILNCWNDYKNLEWDKANHVVRDVAPILWFGNMEEFKKSKTKIVSVGLNPSDSEFKKNDDAGSCCLGLRFPSFAGAGDNADSSWIEKYTDAMNNYFEENPYSRWFSSIECPLNFLGASFYEGKEFENRAVHIDFCAPVATSPTWRYLPEEEQADLAERFRYCFEGMMRELDPDIVLVSVARPSANEIFGDSKSLWKATPKKGYNYELLEGRNPANGKTVKYIFGRNNRGTLFGGISVSVLEEMFQQIKTFIKN